MSTCQPWTASGAAAVTRICDLMRRLAAPGDLPGHAHTTRVEALAELDALAGADPAARTVLTAAANLAAVIERMPTEVHVP
jgi:hypothetical protein